MPSLKALRTRINSVKSTQKITSAMKMVAASKLRRAQTQAEAARPYAVRMERMLASLAAGAASSPTAPPLLIGTGKEQVHLLVPVTGDRGLAGAFNSSVARLTRELARRLEAQGKTVKMLTVGRKGRDILRRDFASRIVGEVSLAGKRTVGFADAQEIAARIVGMLDAGEFDVCTLVLQPLRLRDLAGADRDAADPGAVAGAGGSGVGRGARRGGIRAGRRNDPRRAAAARAGHSGLSRACWRTPPDSTARR